MTIVSSSSVGHLYQRRFAAQLVEEETYLLTVARYVVLNPVRARMVAAPGDWAWSSYRATAGLEKTPPWLHTASVLDRFDEWDGANAAALYRLIAASIGSSESPWEKLRSGLYLGSEAFMERIKRLTLEGKWKREHLKLQQNVRAVDIGRVRAEVERHFATALGGSHCSFGLPIFAMRQQPSIKNRCWIRTRVVCPFRPTRTMEPSITSVARANPSIVWL